MQTLQKSRLHLIHPMWWLPLVVTPFGPLGLRRFEFTTKSVGGNFQFQTPTKKVQGGGGGGGLLNSAGHEQILSNLYASQSIYTHAHSFEFKI